MPKLSTTFTLQRKRIVARGQLLVFKGLHEKLDLHIAISGLRALHDACNAVLYATVPVNGFRRPNLARDSLKRPSPSDRLYSYVRGTDNILQELLSRRCWRFLRRWSSSDLGPRPSRHTIR